MAAKSGIAFKLLQWFVRGIQFCCAAIVLAIFSYFLAALHNHNLAIPTWVRAVEGVSGVAVLYTLVGLLLLCCLAGHPVTSFIATALDVAFIGGFIYVASANRGGAGSCTGRVETPFGNGQANQKPNSDTDGFTKLPTYGEACKVETACMAVSIVAIFFFIFSILIEIALVRHRRKENRFGPGPSNNYTSGTGKPRRGFFGLFKRKTTNEENPNLLPEFTHPDEVRPSYNPDGTPMAPEPVDAYPKYGEAGYVNDGRTAYPQSGGLEAGHPAQAGYR